MKTSRQHILEYIQAHRAVTAAELRTALNSTEANIRHHLTILKQLGLIEVIATRPPAGSSGPSTRGRPARVYGPSPVIMGTNLKLLMAALLEAVRAGFGAAALEATLRQAADMLSESISDSSPEPGERLSARLFHAVQLLNRLHYQARWEARPLAPQIILGHCPYADLAVDHPEICLVDARLLENLVGRPVRQVQRLARDRRGAAYCAFSLIADPASPTSK